MDKKIVLPDIYNKNFTCGNCSSSIGLKIPMGITVWDFAKEHKCLNCGCMLVPQDVKEYSYAERMPSLFLPYYGLRR